MNKRPEFEALSYVWGDSSGVEPIFIDGKIKYIRLNLLSALRSLRHRTSERVLWIDALCINQENDLERMHQVRCMGDIYAQASSVIVWLGNEWTGADIDMEWFEIWVRGPELHPDANVGPSTNINDLSSQKLAHHALHFYDNPWWKRLWTVQEAVLAKRLIFQCAKRTLSGDLLFESFKNRDLHARNCCEKARWYCNRSKTFRMSVKVGDRLLHDLDKARAELPFTDLLYQLALFRNRQASDGCDIIYGVLGLAPDSLQKSLRPSYTRSIRDVYKKSMLTFIRQFGNLDALSHLYMARECSICHPLW